MKEKILFATGNRDKADELRAILTDYEIVIPADIGLNGDVEENGTSFEENALIKARAAHKGCALVCVADDSGVCVDALDGAPGIYSARYSGGDYLDNNVKLLAALKGLPWEKRTAQFVSAAAAVFPDGREAAVSGIVPGHICEKADGEGGFGYDPLFWCDEAGKTYAAMTTAEKNMLSHRKLAFEKLKPVLAAYFAAVKK